MASNRTRQKEISEHATPTVDDTASRMGTSLKKSDSTDEKFRESVCSIDISSFSNFLRWHIDIEA